MTRSGGGAADRPEGKTEGAAAPATPGAFSVPGGTGEGQRGESVPRVPDRYASLPVLEMREEPPAGPPRLRWEVTKLVRRSGSKYALLRVQERWQQGKTGPVMVAQSAMVADHVMVRLKPNVRVETLINRFRRLNPELRRRLPASNVWLVSFQAPGLDTVPRALEEMRRAVDLVEHVRPDAVVHVAAAPNDTGFSSQWGLHNNGQNGGTVDVDIDGPEAWNLGTGSRSVVVAMIDSGMDLVHPDLAANRWSNPHEIAGNGIDDDGNGYVDDVHGWDFASDDNNPQDEMGHGTHVAGILGAVGNNALGVSGVAWQVSIASLKFTDAVGDGTISDAIEATYYATSIGALLSSNSWSGVLYDPLLKTAIEDANAHGVLYVAAAGNEGANTDISARYPSSYTMDNVIAVACVNRSGALSWFSNYGQVSVDLGAPGEEIYSTTAGGGYGTMGGTSMAAPMVSGTCALLKAFKPGLTARDIKAIVLSSAQPLASLAGKCSTGGLLNARAALEVANDLAVAPGDVYAAAGEAGLAVTPATRTYTITNNSTASAPWTSSVTQSWLSLTPSSGTLQAGQSLSVTATLLPAVKGLPIGTHSASFSIVSSTTGRVFTRPVVVEITQQYLLNAMLDSHPGWTLSGLWQYGAPQGAGGLEHGAPDPTAGVTGVNVIGINLAGDYPRTSAGPYYVQAPVLNLSQYQGARLRFQSWLNCDYQPYFRAEAQISTNGTDWTAVYANAQNDAMTQTAWTRQDISIASLVDGQSQVYLRFMYQTEEGVYAYSGWNLDDIQILATPQKRLSLTLPVAAVQEGAGGVTATLTVSPVATSALAVSVSSSTTEQATVSTATVTVPAGQATATFTVNPVNDTWLDGSQTVTISATASGYQAASTTLTVNDNETAVLTVAGPSSVTEGATGQTGTVSVPTAVTRAVQVQLASNDVTEIQVPASVTVAQGATQASFPITVMDDELIDGSQTAQISASVPNWTTGTKTVTVADNETRYLTLSLQPGFAENQGTISPGGTVRLSGIMSTDVSVALSSSDPAHLTLVSPVVIPAGEREVPVQLTLVNDPAHTGQIAVTVTAQAATFTNGTTVTQVYDLQSVAVAAQPSPGASATQMAPDADLGWEISTSGSVPESFDVYFGTSAVLGAAQKAGSTAQMTWALPRLTRGTTYYWRVDSRNATDTVTGPVWHFTVAPVGGIDHFAWSVLPASTLVETDVTATVTARDLYDDTVTAFNGSAALSTQTGTAAVLITEIAHDAAGAVELTNVSPAAVDATGWKLHLYKDSTWPLAAQTVTLGAAVIPAGGVMTVHGGGTAGGGWPVQYTGEATGWAGSSRLAVMLRTGAGEVVDFVCAGAPASQINSPVAVPAGQWSGAAVATAAGPGSYLRTAGDDTQSAADWSASASSGLGVLNAGLAVPFPGTGAVLPVSPAEITFSNGQWTGAVRVGKPHARARLVASDGAGHEGRSGLLAVSSLGMLNALPLVASATEGAGTVGNAVVLSLPATAGADVVLGVVSGDTTEVASASVTIPAGQTSVVIPVTVVNDTILDGSQTTACVVTASGYESAAFNFTVHDNETTTLSVSTPASGSEGAVTALQGTVTVPVTLTVPVTVNLSSSKPAEAAVPASVVIPAGASGAPFAITIQNDAYVDGTQSVQITAGVTGWTSGSGTMNVLDDEARTLSLSLPSETVESAASVQGTLALAGLAPQAMTFNLSATPSGQLTVPATVVVAAGQSSATFAMTAVDDTTKDGSVAVAVTASAATFTSGQGTVMVRDNEAHTFNTYGIASPQVEGAQFLWTVEAFDLNGDPMLAVAGPLTITSTSSTGPVTVSPVTAGPFVSSVWKGQMRVLAPATNVRLTLSSPTASVQTNTFNVGMGPRISVSPASISATVLQDLSADRPVVVTNNGTGPLTWAAAPNTTAVLSSSPVYVATRGTGDWPNVSALYTAPVQSALCAQDAVSDHVPLATVLSNLNAQPAAVTGLIPSRYDFTGGASDWFIEDGGDDIFDYGNFLRTDLSSATESLPYSNNTVVARGDFGTAGRYVTRKVPGLFMLAADLDNVNWLDITGWLGAYDTGSVDSAVLRTTRQGKAYKIMVRRAFNAAAPSVNQMVIVPDVAELNHQISQDCGRQEQRITGLHRAARLYYLLFTLKSGRYLANAEATAVAESFLTVAAGGSWIQAAPASGVLAAGASQTVNVSLRSLGLPLGANAGGLTFVADDEVRSPVAVSASLTVNASVPTLVTEPEFTGGRSNALSWDHLGAGLEYELQRSASTQFASVVSSGWTAATTHTFNDIEEGVAQHYRVRSRLAGQAGWTSRWSAPVVSTQDATGPVVTFVMPEEGFTALPVFTAEGTASDLSAVANLLFAPGSGTPVPAQTSDQYAHWEAALPNLSLGGNSFTVIATDHATPANTTTVSWTVTRLDPNQSESMLAAAFHVDPESTGAPAVTLAQPVLGLQTGADSKQYLTVSFRRRLQPAGFRYVVETSPDLTTWSSTGGDVSEISALPTGDGVTEICTCRITPALGESAGKFVRVRPVLD